MTDAPNRQPLHQSDRSVSLSRIERLAKRVVQAQIRTPRSLAPRLIFHELLHRSGVIGAMVFFFTLVIGTLVHQYVLHGERVFSDPDWIALVVLLILAAISLIVNEFGWKTWHWHRAITRGRFRIIEVRTITKSYERQGYLHVQGAWQPLVAQQRAQRFALDTRITGHWIGALAPGDRVVALVHPTKPRILLVLGPATQHDIAQHEQMLLEDLLMPTSTKSS